MGATIGRPRHAARPLTLIIATLALLLGVIATLATAGPGRAASPYTVGDVFAGVGGGAIKEFSPTGTLIQTLSAPASTEDSGMTFDLAGNLYATQFTVARVVKFDNAGNFLGTFGGGYSGGPESIVRDFVGNFYVGQADGTHQVLKFDAAGNPLGSFSPAIDQRGTDWVDLAADQCTLFYTSEGKLIKRFNVCTNTQLADFATLPIDGVNPGINPSGSVAYALRILPDQTVLVAASKQVFHLDTAGNVIQTYPNSTFSGSGVLFALNLDADLQSFWTADLNTGQVFRVNIGTGALITSFNAGPLNPSLAGLAVFGEVTAAQPKLELTPTSDSKPVGASETLTAKLINVINPAGTAITFTVTGVNPQTSTVAADASGTATFTYTGANVGMDTVVATATTVAPALPSGANLTSNASQITWTQAKTTLTYNGATTSDFHDPATVSATLTSQVTNSPIPGQTVVFTLNGAETCNGVTDASGKASCSITPNEAAGSYSLVASFAGSANYLPSSTTVNFVVTLEETTLTITSSNTLATGSPVSAQLLEDGNPAVPIAGRTVSFSAVPTGGGSTITGTGVTDAAGNVTVNLGLAPGEYDLTATFAGDAFYQPSTATQHLVVFQPTNFVIWGGNNPDLTKAVVVGQDYMFWGAQWAKQVTAGDFTANNSFKGYADIVTGKNWTTRPGNSSNPPASVATYIGVIVATHIDKSGSTISGNVAEIVVLKVDNPSAYAPNPGHSGTGIMVAVVH